MPSNIPWCHETWNPITGCSPVSIGCKNCYAKEVAETRLRGRCGYDDKDPFKITLHANRLHKPDHWKKPRRIFVGSMGDLLHDDNFRLFSNFELLGDIFRVISQNRHHRFMILTKRPENISKLLDRFPYLCAMDHIWWGVSVENQETANERISKLCSIAGINLFASVEPMLEEMNLCDIEDDNSRYSLDALNGAGISEYESEFAENDEVVYQEQFNSLDWIICGGENGHGGRPFNDGWAEILHDQCFEHNVPFFAKTEVPGLPREYPEGLLI